MEQAIIDYLDKYEEKLRKTLLKLATDRKALEGKLLESDDLKAFWHRIEPNYMADAVPQIASYPTVSVAWALYLGMGAAYYWDADWATYSNTDYDTFYGDQGFDNMDDHIVRDVLGLPLESEEAKKLVSLVQSLAQEAVDMIRHEQIEPQSKMAFYAFARACDAMFAIGAAIQLERMGYKFEKLNN